MPVETKMWPLIVLLSLVCPAAVRAQDDPAVVQRCGAACLDSATGATDPIYAACVASQCSAADALPAQAPGGDWRYDRHPVFGSAAFTNLPGGGSIGLACWSHGTDGSSGVVSLMITNDLFVAPDITVLFDTDPTAFSLLKSDGAFTARAGTSCDVGLDAFRGAAQVILAPGRIEAILRDGDTPTVTLGLDGIATDIHSGTEAQELPGVRTISLKGSSTAIRRLIQTCPQIQADIDNFCGL